MAAVDSIPVANLHSTSNETPAVGTSISKIGGGRQPSRSLSSTPSSQTVNIDSRRSSGTTPLPSYSPPSARHMDVCGDAGAALLAKDGNSSSSSVSGVSRTAGSGWSSTATTASATGAAAGMAGSSGQFRLGRSSGNGSNINSRERPKTSSSWPNEGRHRMRGVGANVSTLSPSPASCFHACAASDLAHREQAACMSLLYARCGDAPQHDILTVCLWINNFNTHIAAPNSHEPHTTTPIR